jgi:hypothetical protein
MLVTRQASLSFVEKYTGNQENNHVDIQFAPRRAGGVG